jgi:hypothetical protein
MRRSTRFVLVSSTAIFAATAAHADPATGWPDVTPKWWTPPAGAAPARDDQKAGDQKPEDTKSEVKAAAAPAVRSNSSAILSAAELKLAGKDFLGTYNKSDVEALADHYRTALLCLLAATDTTTMPKLSCPS